MYIIGESDGLAQPVLILSNPSSINFTVLVLSTDGLAIGENF